jgi:serine/threonine-protein kinase RsbW
VDDVEIKLALFLPRDAASVPVSRQVLDGCLETLGVTPDTRTDIALALSEACANVVQHAGPGVEYEVLATARNGRCVIEVINTVNRPGPAAAPADPGVEDLALEDLASEDRAPALAAEPASAELGPLSAEPVTATAEHGRGLKIIDALTDNLQLTGDGRAGTTVHFEKVLSWIPGAAGEHLFSARA